MLFGSWLYDYGLLVKDGRLRFSPGMTQEDLATAAKSYDLSAHPPTMGWSKALRAFAGKRDLHGDRRPARPLCRHHALRKAGTDHVHAQSSFVVPGGLWNDSMRIDLPGLWLMTWYDVSIGPNLEAYNYVRSTASPAVAAEQSRSSRRQPLRLQTRRGAHHRR